MPIVQKIPQTSGIPAGMTAEENARLKAEAQKDIEKLQKVRAEKYSTLDSQRSSGKIQTLGAKPQTSGIPAGMTAEENARLKAEAQKDIEKLQKVRAEKALQSGQTVKPQTSGIPAGMTAEENARLKAEAQKDIEKLQKVRAEKAVKKDLLDPTNISREAAEAQGYLPKKPLSPEFLRSLKMSNEEQQAAYEAKKKADAEKKIAQEQQRLAERKKIEEEQRASLMNKFGVANDIDGNNLYKIGKSNISVSKSGGINFDSADDLKDLDYVDMERINLIEDVLNDEKAYIKDITSAKLNSIENRKKTTTTLYNQASALRSDIYNNIIDRANQEKIKALEESEIAEEQYRINSAESLEQLEETRDLNITRLKASLFAMGALDSTNGLFKLSQFEVNSMKDLQRAKSKVDLELQQMALDQADIRQKFVNDIMDITFDQQNKELQAKNEYLNVLNDLEEDRMFTVTEKARLGLDAINKYRLSKDRILQEAQANKLEAQKQAMDFAKDIMKQRVEQTGYQFELDEELNPVYVLDPDGNPIPTMDKLKYMLDVQKEQNDQDKQLSEQTGYLYVGGAPVIDSKGNPIATLNYQKYSFEQTMATKKLGLQEKTLMLNAMKFDAQQLDKNKNSYDLKEDENGEYVYIQRPNSLGIGNEVITGYGSPAWKYGLDVDGEKGQPLVVPHGGEVKFAGKNGGFGNQVVVGVGDYDVMYSHLDRIDVGIGAKLALAGAIIGTIGNSGTVIPSQGGDGSHVDITIKNNKTNKYLSSQEVETFLRSKTSENAGQVIRTGVFADAEKANKNIFLQDAFFNLFDEDGNFKPTRASDYQSVLESSGFSVSDLEEKEIVFFQDYKTKIMQNPEKVITNEEILNMIHKRDNSGNFYYSLDKDDWNPWMVSMEEEIDNIISTKAPELEYQKGLIKFAAREYRKKIAQEVVEVDKINKPVLDAFMEISYGDPKQINEKIDQFFLTSGYSREDFEDEIKILQELTRQPGTLEDLSFSNLENYDMLKPFYKDNVRTKLKQSFLSVY